MLRSEKLALIIKKINRENPIIPHILPNQNHSNTEIEEELLDLMYSQLQANEKSNIAYFAAKHGSFGDLVFGAKVTGSLKKYFPSAEILIITNAKEDILKSQIHLEHDIDEAQIITDLEYTSAKTFSQNDLSLKIAKPTLIIEAPSFSLLRKLAPEKLEDKTSILLISEYGADQKLHPTVLSAEQQKKEYGQSINISAINAGLNPSEAGILIAKNDEMNRLTAWEMLTPKLKHALLENQSVEAFENNQTISASYGHYKFSTFVKIDSELEQYSGKHANLIMLGLSMNQQLSAIEEIKPYLLDKGFTQLIIHDVASNEKKFFDLVTRSELNEPIQEEDQRNFKIIFYPKFLHREALVLRDISGPFKGTTGDQSFGEAIGSEKDSIIAYETMIWKRGLISGYRKLAANYGEGVTRAITLLTWGATDSEKNDLTNEQIEELGNLLRNQDVQNNIFQLHAKIRQDLNLYDRIIMRVNRLLLQETYPWLKELSTAVLANNENIDQAIDDFNQALQESSEKLMWIKKVADELIELLTHIINADIDQIHALELQIKSQIDKLDDDPLIKPFVLKTLQEKMNEWMDAERKGLDELGILKINYQEENVEKEFLRLVEDVAKEIKQDLQADVESELISSVVSSNVIQNVQEQQPQILSSEQVIANEIPEIRKISEVEISKKDESIVSDQKIFKEDDDLRNKQLREKINRFQIQPFVLSNRALQKDKNNLEKELFELLTKKSQSLKDQLIILQMLYFEAKSNKENRGLISSNRWKDLMDVYKNVYIEILRQPKFNTHLKKDAAQATSKMIDDQMGFVKTSQTNLRKDVNAVLGNYAKYSIKRGIKKR